MAPQPSAEIIPFPRQRAVVVPAAALGILIAASFDGAIAARNRGAPGLANDINDAIGSVSQAMADQGHAPPPHGLAPDTRLVVCHARDGHDHETTWGAFSMAHAEALAADLPLVVSALARGETFTGGPRRAWTIRRA